MSTTELSSLLVNQVPQLQPFAVSLTQDRESAKDLTQETLYRALSNMDKYQLGTNIRSWLYTIMRNIFINDYRAKKRRPRPSSDEQQVLHLPDQRAGLLALSRLATREIEQSVHYLPEIFRSAFLLYVEGYKYHEIAEMLGEPLGTIKSRIHFARKTLKEKISRN